MKQFREDTLLEQLIRKPKVGSTLTADRIGNSMNKTRNYGEFNK